jgi:hypothetical protein
MAKVRLVPPLYLIEQLLGFRVSDLGCLRDAEHTQWCFSDLIPVPCSPGELMLRELEEFNRNGDPPDL